MLGKIDLELSTYVGKIFQEATLPIVSGRIKNGQITAKMSVVPIPQAP